ncbi:MAG: YfbK domain-containing protein, partial [Pseudomonadota bacterium]
YGFLKLRYKLPEEQKSKLVTLPIGPKNEFASFSAAPNEARFATAVAAFGQILKGGKYTGSYGYDDVIKLAQSAKGKDEFGYRAEFINLVRLAKSAPAMPELRR